MVYLIVEKLPQHVIEKDMDDLFSRYGRIVYLDIKMRRREMTVVVVEYASMKESEDACRELGGFLYKGNRLRTELWKQPGDTGPHSQFTTQHRAHISNLPPSASTEEVQDLIGVVADNLALEVDRRGNAWASFPTSYELERVVNAIHEMAYQNEYLVVKPDETLIFTPDPNTQPGAPSTANVTGRSSTTSNSTSVPSPSTSRSRNERTTSSNRSRSRSRSTTRYRRRITSRSPTRRRSDRRSRSRSRSAGHSSSRRRSRSRSR